MMVVLRNYRLFAPVGWDQSCTTQLFLQNKLWNKLVELDKEAREKYLALQGTDPGAQQAKHTLSTLHDELDTVEKERAEARKLFCKKSGVEIAPFDFKIRQLKQTIGTTKKELKPIFDQAKENLKDQSKQLAEEFKKEVVQARQAAAAEGVWWCNYNAVIQSFEVARSRCMKSAESELQFHSFDGQGRLTVQIQNGCSVEELCSGRRNDVSLRLVSEGEFEEIINRDKKSAWSNALVCKEIGSKRFNRQYGVLKVTVYTSKDEDNKPLRKTVDFPLILHRPLPETAALKTLTVSKRKVGLKYEYSVSFTFTEADQEIVHDNEEIVGLNLGWKRVANGLRIGTLVSDAGIAKNLVLPSSFEDTHRYLNSLHSEIDLLTNELWALIKEFDTTDESLLPLLTRIQRAKRPRIELCLTFIRRWRDSGLLISDSDVLPRYKVLKLKFLEHRNLGDKLKRRRTDLYRKWAKEIVEQYAVVRIDKLDLAKAALLEKPDGTASELDSIARYLRVVAGVSEFKEWLVKQAAKVGSVVEELQIASTITCSACGATSPTRPAFLRWQCHWCGAVWDQDKNAALNLLQAA